MWTSVRGIYVAYDANNNRLRFPERGHILDMGCQSSGAEPDAILRIRAATAWRCGWRCATNTQLFAADERHVHRAVTAGADRPEVPGS